VRADCPGVLRNHFSRAIQITHTYCSKRKESGKLRRLSLAISLLAILTHLAVGGRYFDARTGRFVQIDPLAGKYAGNSPYGYALNNPLKYIDPTGEWVAQYDANNRAVTVQAEEGDDLKSLYSQMGMNETKFADYYGFKDMSDFRVVGGETTFDVTGLVTPNTEYDPSSNFSNCHGFVAVATGKVVPEDQLVGAMLSSSLGNPSAVNGPMMGDIGIFTTTGLYGDPMSARDVTGEPGHSAIYVIENQSGEPQFLNRPNTGLSVTISTQTEISSYFTNLANRGREIVPGWHIPELSATPNYYRMR
jgi:hypothetical protein